ncbi:AhpC/TSA family protein [Blastopirellula sp. JC732]|uniref:thioredoxin-dependent peroxiredoxin n=2 Tax=Blastopirellula sediminis TaxID=2894196 RepID=A0A9X1SHM6_9BACT|nr:peroxiredoxin-like family protein [Blastopirellula sediminis]MCC9606103.1 AhpC/TSA family protein [Blastopirellula sediminis]MCC9630598.1 AhpC/TSA family protein [Blastopirellula sediminis]
MGQESQPQTLQQQLKQKSEEAGKRFPPEMLKTMRDAVQTVRDTGIEKSAKQVSDAAIDAELTGWNGKTVKLSDAWSEGPVVLMWYRGGWCPYCNLQLRAMQKELKAIEGAGAKLIVLTPELPEKAKETAEANDVDFVALYDKENGLARKYGLVFALPDPILPLYRDRLKLAEVNGSDAMELPLSATYVIDTKGKIRYAFLDADYTQRAEPADVVAAVKQVAGEKK